MLGRHAHREETQAVAVEPSTEVMANCPGFKETTECPKHIGFALILACVQHDLHRNHAALGQTALDLRDRCRGGYLLDRYKLVGTVIPIRPTRKIRVPAAKQTAVASREQLRSQSLFRCSIARALLWYHPLRTAAHHVNPNFLKKRGRKVGFSDVFGVKRERENRAASGEGIIRQFIQMTYSLL